MTEVEAGGRRGRRTGGNDRVDQQPGFVLHSYPWRETSLIIEAFTRDHGRMALVARGAKRPTSQLRGLLDPFCPLALSWSGRNEIKSLVRVEWLGGLAPLRGDGLLAAFYLNELLVRLMIRADAHEHLFAAYIGALRALAQDGADQQSILRGFELDLLREIGYLPPLDHAAEGEPIEPARWYHVDSQRGWVATDAPDALSVQGATLRAMAARDFRLGRTAAQSKSLLRQLIRYHLNGQPLNTRRILQDLRALETVDPA
ncbi:MAG: DNA repair protein RecO [Burkholderiales bacterium]|jgi:DNA repair protein RecO (recombination protein O)|nr:DNA repair protein RecO [Burkholderiales bacterium]MCA3228037.1 DNA repair protein RecO [Burkholderiales bacterium]